MCRFEFGQIRLILTPVFRLLVLVHLCLILLQRPRSMALPYALLLRRQDLPPAPNLFSNVDERESADFGIRAKLIRKVDV